MNHYYLIAGLPALSLDGDVPLTFEEFRKLAESHISLQEKDALNAIAAGPDTPCRHPFVREWQDVEKRIRNAVVRIRAARRRVEPDPYLREAHGFSVALEKAVSDAFSLPDPLQRERALDRLRWQQADELAGFDPFSSRALLAYAVKLTLAERWSKLTEEAGRTKAETVIENQCAKAKPEMEKI